ncbi:MAG: hypothetical protein Q8Q08_08470 [Candidatus Omnitrophota bacterium]|nr:hypothetical protein [Candidatus Omnitrophota bacterium]MDZ4241707.1 hypothetical protein [Candidatus Omnitrophota bacterium]
MGKLILVAVLTCIVTAAFFLILGWTNWVRHYRHSRRKDYDPLLKHPTMFDVRRLLLEGEKDLALRVYRRIFRRNDQKAKEEVDQLDKSLPR